MAIDMSVRRSRRALLAGGIGGLAAATAAALGRPLPARAGEDGDVVLDATNVAFGTTTILSSTFGGPLFVAQSTTGGTGLTGISHANVGVHAESDLDIGLEATSATGTAIVAGLSGAGDAAIAAWAAAPATATITVGAGEGIGVNVDGGEIGVQVLASDAGISCEGGRIGVEAWSRDGGAGVGGIGYGDGTGVGGASHAGMTDLGGSGTGVYGFSGSGNGVYGECETGVGVLGYSGGGAPPTSLANTGVYGYAAEDAYSRGVTGQSTAGRGVNGLATTGYGVRGYASTGTAIYGATGGLKSGTALRTVGRVRFDNSVGIATIAGGTNSVTVTPGIDLTAASAVVATLQGNAGSAATTVSRVFVNATTDQFTIYLTANATAAVKVAWHVFG